MVNNRGEVPVMAWVNATDVRRFKSLYPKKGAISDMIRRAFKIAIEETAKTEVAARQNRDSDLGPPGIVESATGKDNDQ